MSKIRKVNGKEILVRLMCFALGVLLTLSGVLIRERYIINSEDKVEESEEIKEEDIKSKEEVDVETNTKSLDFELYKEEAESLYQELVTAAGEETTEETAVNDDGTYTIEGKTSKLNWKMDYPLLSEENTLEWHAARETSYASTLTTNELDKKIIENNTIDFSGVKISILGDSITAATNLSEEEQELYNYPKLLGDILGCEVVNMGIGGSVVSRCASNYPMVDRWYEIPEDSDIIIVMGGTNDCLFMNKWDFGHLEYDKRMVSGTFCGDLDEMCGGFKRKYHEEIEDRYVKLIYVNPMCTILNDAVYATDPGNMMEQISFAQAINEIAPTYEMDVIDLYNSNFLNSHDPDVNREFITDGVHPNTEGYRILAEHLASQIIQRINQ